MDFTTLTQTAISAALAAGKIIQAHMRLDVDVLEKQGGNTRASQVLTKVDLECEKAILAALLPSCQHYDLALLSEETEDDGSRFKKDFFWCIDPMDGTLAFINKTPGFSVSIALVAKDGTPHIGVVYDPSTDTLYHATKGQGAYKNGSTWSPSCDNEYFTYVTDKRPEDLPQSATLQLSLKQVLAQHSATQALPLARIKILTGGGAVLNAIRVVENGPACMFKQPKPQQGGGSLWDYAATACIFNELGLSATTYTSTQLMLNRKEGSFMNVEGVLFSNL